MTPCGASLLQGRPACLWMSAVRNSKEKGRNWYNAIDFSNWLIYLKLFWVCGFFYVKSIEKFGILLLFFYLCDIQIMGLNIFF